MAIAQVTGETMLLPVELTVISCGGCGGHYAISERFRRKKYEDSGFWVCPYCRTEWGYPRGETLVDSLKKQLEQQKRSTQWAKDDADWQAKERKAVERRLTAAKGQQTKLKKRIAAGVCPCCHRTFKQLSAHMAQKHPDFAAAEQPTIT